MENIAKVMDDARRMEGETWREAGFFISLATVPDDVNEQALAALAYTIGGALSDKHPNPLASVSSAIRLSKAIRDNAYTLDSDTYRAGWVDDGAEARLDAAIQAETGAGMIRPTINTNFSVSILPTYYPIMFPIYGLDALAHNRAVATCEECGFWYTQIRTDNHYCRIKCRDRQRSRRYRNKEKS